MAIKRRLGTDHRTQHQARASRQDHSRQRAGWRGSRGQTHSGHVAAPSGQVLHDEPDQHTGQTDGEDRPPGGQLVIAEILGQGVPHDVLELVYGGQEAEGDQ